MDKEKSCFPRHSMSLLGTNPKPPPLDPSSHRPVAVILATVTTTDISQSTTIKCVKCLICISSSNSKITIMYY